MWVFASLPDLMRISKAVASGALYRAIKEFYLYGGLDR
jgi:hypothetical protein